jgi:hypothetical protein
MSDLSGAPIVFKEMNETHSQGVISIENLPDDKIFNGDLGIQIGSDGRVWVCINGIAFLRFNPKIKIEEKPNG